MLIHLWVFGVVCVGGNIAKVMVRNEFWKSLITCRKFGVNSGMDHDGVQSFCSKLKYFKIEVEI